MSISPSRLSVKKNPEKRELKPSAKKTINAGVTKKKAVKKRIKPVFRPPNLHWRLAIAGILGMVMIGGIFYTSHQLKTQVNDTEQKRGQMVALSQKGENFKEVSSSLALVKEEIPLIEKALLVESQMVDFLNQVDKIKKDSGITTGTLSFTNDQPGLDEKGNHYLELVIKAEGEVEKLGAFVNNLLKLPILIRVKVFDVAKLDEAAGEMVFKAWLYADPNFFEKTEKLKDE